MPSLADMMRADAGVPAGNQGSLADMMRADAAAPIQQPAPVTAQQPTSGGFMNGVRNVLGGVVYGAGDMVTRPIDWVTGTDHAQHMQQVNDRLVRNGYDPTSGTFATGKIGSEVALTAPVGGLVAKGLRAIPGVATAVPKLVSSIESGGFSLGSPAATTIAGKAADLATRAAGGATVGGLSAGMVDPNQAGTGAMIGAVLPGGVQAANAIGQTINGAGHKLAQALMQSALKPTIKQLRTGDAQVAIDTLLKYGINPTERGVYKLGGMVDDLNSQISDKIANSNAVINKSDVLNYLQDPADRFSNQVSPTSDLNAIVGVAQDFINHPGMPGKTIPVQMAQALKQGTYKALSGKYGEVGSAATEAQKALARGLKDEIGKAVPDVIPLNAEESNLIKTLNVSERRALMDLNKNPFGLAALAQSPSSFALFLADRSAAFKGIAARMVNKAASAPASASSLAQSAGANPLLRNAVVLPAISSGNP